MKMRLKGSLGKLILIKMDILPQKISITSLQAKITVDLFSLEIY